MSFKEHITNIIQKQYADSNVADLLLNKASVWDKFFGLISERFLKEVLNFDTCSSEALDNYWGKLFKITRNFTNEDGETFSLTDEQFREVLKIRAFGTSWNGTVRQMNIFLPNIFGERGKIYMLDPQDMTYQIFLFQFELEDWEKYLFNNYDILPRCAGVGSQIQIVEPVDYFALKSYGQIYEFPGTTGFQTYEQQKEGKILTYGGETND